ncbi:MAG TPA: hypothetical protein VI485_23100 [Vicinamibacterales bacterium]|nr:hypothetical protein [Vicinamibacterales bacterium]
MLAGTATHLEAYLLAKVYGKPKEEIDLKIGPLDEPEDLSSLSLFELHQRAEDITRRLREAHELNTAIPAEYRSVLSVDSSDHAKSPAELSSDASVDAQNPVELSVDSQDSSDSAGLSASNQEQST